jgi:hypothetical protein
MTLSPIRMVSTPEVLACAGWVTFFPAPNQHQRHVLASVCQLGERRCRVVNVVVRRDAVIAPVALLELRDTTSPRMLILFRRADEERQRHSST